MKNLNTILVGIFAAISITEITYPIILTGPARRNAHRKQAEEEEILAYELGSEHERNEQQAQENKNDEVNVQFLDEDSDENYSDDAVVQIQALGDGTYLNKLSPDEKDALKERIKKRLADPNNSSDQGVTTQSMSDFDDNEEAFMQGDYTDDAIIQSIEAEHHDEHTAQPATAQLEQAVHVTSDFAQSVEHQEHPSSAPQATLMHVAEPAAPESQAQPIAPKQSEEQIKIVKVYPVYDAIKSGVDMVRSAANDMYNYAYNLISSYRSGRTEKAEVKVQQFPSRWKA